MEIAVVRLPLGPHATVPATWMQDHALLFGQAGSVEGCFHELCNEMVSRVRVAVPSAPAFLGPLGAGPQLQLAAGPAGSLTPCMTALQEIRINPEALTPEGVDQVLLSTLDIVDMQIHGMRPGMLAGQIFGTLPSKIQGLHELQFAAKHLLPGKRVQLSNMVRGVRDALEVPAPQVAAADPDVAHIAEVVGAAVLEQGQALVAGAGHAPPQEAGVQAVNVGPVLADGAGAMPVPAAGAGAMPVQAAGAGLMPEAAAAVVPAVPAGAGAGPGIAVGAGAGQVQAVGPGAAVAGLPVVRAFPLQGVAAAVDMAVPGFPGLPGHQRPYIGLGGARGPRAVAVAASDASLRRRAEAELRDHRALLSDVQHATLVAALLSKYRDLESGLMARDVVSLGPEVKRRFPAQRAQGLILFLELSAYVGDVDVSSDLRADTNKMTQQQYAAFALGHDERLQRRARKAMTDGIVAASKGKKRSAPFTAAIQGMTCVTTREGLWVPLLRAARRFVRGAEKFSPSVTLLQQGKQFWPLDVDESDTIIAENVAEHVRGSRLRMLQQCLTEVSTGFPGFDNMQPSHVFTLHLAKLWLVEVAAFFAPPYFVDTAIYHNVLQPLESELKHWCRRYSSKLRFRVARKPALAVAVAKPVRKRARVGVDVSRVTWQRQKQQWQQRQRLQMRTPRYQPQRQSWPRGTPLCRDFVAGLCTRQMCRFRHATSSS